MIDFDSYIKVGVPGGKQRAEAMKQNKNTEIPSFVYRDGMIHQRVCRMVVWLETTLQTKSVEDCSQGEQ